MTKKTLALTIASGLLAASLTGCTSSNADVQALEQKIAALEKENAELKAKDSKNADAPANKEKEKEAESENTTTAAAKDDKTIEANKAIKVGDFAEFTVTGAKFGTKIVPPKPDRFYTYYEVKDQANTYFDVVVKVKSLLTIGKGSDEFVSVKVVYDDKYEYDPFSAIEEKGGGDFTYTMITKIEPLKTGTLHFISEVPAEIAKDKKPIKVLITCNGEEYTYKYR